MKIIERERERELHAFKFEAMEEADVEEGGKWS